MMRNVKRWMLYAAAAFVPAMLLFCGAAYWKYRTVEKTSEPVTVLAEYLSPGEVQLGQTFVLRVAFRVPWNQAPEGIELDETGAGMQEVSEPVFTQTGYGWGANHWTAEAVLQTYRDGTLQPGKLSVFFTKDKFTFDLPEIKSVLPENGAERSGALSLAGDYVPAPEETPAGALIAAGIGLLVVLLALYAMRDLFFPKKTVPEKIETAPEQIARLRQDVKEGKVPLNTALALLGDIVRHYIESTFSIRAERQTTAEFLKELEKDSSPLTERDRRFLVKFMSAADMVKYAGIHADAEMFDSTAERAAEFCAEGERS